MNKFKENFVFFDVEGYSLNPDELEEYSPSPLFSWKKLKGGYTNLHWGCQRFEKVSRSFWLTELCLIKGRDYHKHYIPGAFLRPVRDTESARTLSYIWNNMQDRHVFRRKDIEDQSYVRGFLLNKITPDTVVFYKGGHFEKMIGELCDAKEIVNIEKLGVLHSANIPESLVRDTECKVHWKTFNHCPLQEVKYFMNIVDEWLPKYYVKDKNVEDENMNVE